MTVGEEAATAPDAAPEAPASAFEEIERIISADPGKRGITNLVRPGEFENACRQMISSKHIGIVTGFYIWRCGAGETDGPPGAVAMANALVRLNRKVTLFTDRLNEPVVRACAEKMDLMGKIEDIAIFPCPEDPNFVEGDALDQFVERLLYAPEPGPALEDGAEAAAGGDREGDGGRKRSPRENGYALPARPAGRSEASSPPSGKKGRPRHIDHLISIERVGPSHDGRCYNMRGEDITKYCGRTDRLFTLAKQRAAEGWDPIGTSGIGDGGNEIGMGRVSDLVAQHVNHGERIRCAVATDSLIVAGVSNWGGYAVCAGLYVLAHLAVGGPPPNPFPAPSLLMQPKIEEHLVDAAVYEGAVDGAAGKRERSVDGLPMSEHARVIDAINLAARAHVYALFPALKPPGGDDARGGWADLFGPGGAPPPPPAAEETCGGCGPEACEGSGGGRGTKTAGCLGCLRDAAVRVASDPQCCGMCSAALVCVCCSSPCCCRPSGQGQGVDGAPAPEWGEAAPLPLDPAL
eukprot:tig00001177_g7370.t1